VTAALTPKDLVRILHEKAAGLPPSKSTYREVTMATTTSRRSLIRNSAAAVAAAGFGGRLVRAQDAPIRIGVIYDHSGPFAPS
jgi:hypothetical protein